MNDNRTIVNPAPLLSRIAERQRQEQKPRWLQRQQESLAERERAGGSRFDAVALLSREPVL